MHVYFSGVGGVGIGPLALLALDAGHTVSGSDLTASDLTVLLSKKAAAVSIGQDGSFIASSHFEQPIDWFVYSSALPSGHPELEFAQKHNIKTSKRDEFLNYVLKEKQLKLVAVAGTHGKTTTTGMLVWLFKQLNLPLSYSIGTTLSFGRPAQYQIGSEYFIYECDEFDKNFLNFHPYLNVITTVGYDHPDTYPTENDYIAAFLKFSQQSQHNISWQADEAIFNGKTKDNFSVLGENEPRIDDIKLIGEHNRKNAWQAVQTVFELTKQPIDKLIEIINRFPGTGRRFEKLAQNLYSDYAHHPAEIAATISMAKELNPHVVVVYQPHQNVRQHEMMKEHGYKRCLEGAKKVYWLPTYLSREDENLPVLQPAELAASVDEDVSTEIADLNDGLWQKISKHRQAGNLVLAMSAGDLDSWARERIKHEINSA